MMMTTMADPVLAFLATYLVHSTVLFGAAWLLGAYLVRSEAWRETLWKAALVGGLVTSGAAQVSPWTAVRVALPTNESSAAGAVAPSPVDDDRSPGTTDDQAAETGAGVAAARNEIDANDALGTPVASVPPQRVERAAADVRLPLTWTSVIAGVWALISLMLLARLAWRRVRLARVLRDRRRVTTAGLPETLASLRRTAGVWMPVRLTSTPAIASPLALGSREICVPDRFVTALGPAEQRAALAHELGHLARRDPAWLLGAMLLECVFFFQPLQRVARRGLRESAEYLADSWAVRLAGGRLSLARCLAEVATWVSTSEEPALAEMVAMAEGGSPLLNRVSRLLEREPEQEPRRLLRVATALVIVAAAAAFAPAIDSGRAAVASQQFIDVTFWPERGALNDGLVWADAAARQEGAATYWVAWATPSRVPVGRQESTDSEPVRWSELDGGDIARALGVTHELSDTGGNQPAIMLARFVVDEGQARLDRLVMRAGGNGADVRGHVYWLGNQNAAQSFAWLNDVYRDAQDLRVREAAVEAVSVHDVAEAPLFLRRVIESRAGRNLTEEAVEGLGWHGSDESLAYLTALARSDSDVLISAEATETLGELDHPGAAVALHDLTRGAGDPRMRQEALETLSERGDTALAALLLDIALNDPDESMRREAVELMQDLPAAIAVPLLQRVIAESRDEEAVHEAIESLAEIGTADAFAAIEAVLGHSESGVRREAMEVLAEERGTVRDSETLLQIALHDDDPDNRREAVEYMAELPAEQAVVLLRRVAFESGDGTAERQAAESLGAVGTLQALAVLDEIIARNPGEDASFQAIESIAENFARDLVVPRLTKIAREHPSRRVRREALEYLSELDSGP